MLCVQQVLISLAWGRGTNIIWGGYYGGLNYTVRGVGEGKKHIFPTHICCCCAVYTARPRCVHSTYKHLCIVLAGKGARRLETELGDRAPSNNCAKRESPVTVPERPGRNHCVYIMALVGSHCIYKVNTRAQIVTRKSCPTDSEVAKAPLVELVELVELVDASGKAASVPAPLIAAALPKQAFGLRSQT